ncbi:hypothetical protein K7432_009403 [Basidiobolus ranarum]|uniref:Uncharacterized protein n=1 Tax=Basidiobolus ranarum TaxID=34480 RepID=A0ABR2WQ90_9FUNG
MEALSSDFLKDAERFYSKLSERRRDDSGNAGNYRRRSAIPTVEEVRRIGARSRPYRSKNRVDSTEVSKRLKVYLGSGESCPIPSSHVERKTTIPKSAILQNLNILM